MADDYMADYSSETPEPAAAPREEKSDAKSALLPIAFFQGKELEPGGICSVRIEDVQEDQVLVSYVPHQEEEASEKYAPDDMMG